MTATYFQLRLSGISNCESWREVGQKSTIFGVWHNNCFYHCTQHDRFAKDRDVVKALVENVNDRCECAFSEDRITNGVFQCFPSSPRSVTYHAQLHGTLNANITELFTILKEWLSSGATIPVQLLPLTVSSVCAVSSTPLEHCPDDVVVVTEAPTTPTTPLPLITIVAGGGVVVFLAIVILIIVVIIIAGLVKLKHSRRANKMDLSR